MQEKFGALVTGRNFSAMKSCGERPWAAMTWMQPKLSPGFKYMLYLSHLLNSF